MGVYLRVAIRTIVVSAVIVVVVLAAVVRVVVDFAVSTVVDLTVAAVVDSAISLMIVDAAIAVVLDAAIHAVVVYSVAILGIVYGRQLAIRCGSYKCLRDVPVCTKLGYGPLGQCCGRFV